jgi:hypothetical protein
LLFQEISSCGDSGYTFDACKRLAKEYVSKYHHIGRFDEDCDGEDSDEVS